MPVGVATAVALLAALSVSAGGCALLANLDETYAFDPDADVAPDDGGLRDAALDAADGTIEPEVEAGRDAALDAAIVDAMANSADSASFLTTQSCAAMTHHTFCQDFDESTDVDAGWRRADPGPDLQLDDESGAPTPPACLRVTEEGALQTLQTIPFEGSRLTIQLDLEPPLLVNDELTVLELFDVENDYYLELTLSPLQTVLEEAPADASPADHPFATSLALGVWSHVAIIVDFSTTPYTLAAAVNGSTQLSTQATFSASDPALVLAVGELQGGPSPEGLRIDNVTVDVVE